MAQGYLFVVGFFVAYYNARNLGSDNSERLQKSLEVCQANVMVADNDFNICYMNQSVIRSCPDYTFLMIGFSCRENGAVIFYAGIILCNWNKQGKDHE